MADLQQILSLPHIWDIVVHGDEEDRERYFVGVFVAIGLLLLSTVLALVHQRELYRAEASDRAHYYQLMHLLPLVVAVACCLEVSLSTVAAATLVLQEIWEAVALHYFGLTIVCLMGGKEATVQKLASCEAHGSFGTSRWCVPPCCCLVPLTPCLQDGNKTFDFSILRKMRFMIEQYCYVTPLTAFVEGILQWQEKQQQIHMDFWVGSVQVLRLVSMFICLQALFALYHATKKSLKKYQTTLKFLSIKALIFLSAVQKILLAWVFRWHLVDLPPSRVFSAADAALRMHAFLLLMEVPFLQLLVNHAFPADELHMHSQQLLG